MITNQDITNSLAHIQSIAVQHYSTTQKILVYNLQMPILDCFVSFWH